MEPLPKRVLVPTKWWTAVFLLLLLPYLYISRFIHPAADDYCMAADAGTGSILESIQNQYLSLNGRYFANFVLLLNPLSSEGLLSYRLFPVLMLVALFVSLRGFIRALFQFMNIEDEDKPGFLSVTLILVFLGAVLSPSECLYWFTSTVVYTLSIVLCLFSATLFINIFLLQKMSSMVHHVLLIALIIASSGMNEIQSSVNMMFFISCALWLKLNNKPMKPALLAGALTFVCCLAILFAPGTSTRAGYYSDNFQLGHSLYMSIRLSASFLIGWIKSPTPWLFAIVTIPFMLKLKLKSDASARFFLNPLFPLSIILSTLFFATFLPTFGTGILGQYRTIDLASFYFLLMWIWLWVGLTRKFFPNFEVPPRGLHVLRAGLFVLLLTTGNGKEVVRELSSGEAAAYDSEQINRDQLIRSCLAENSDSCVVPFLQHKPKIICSYDITDDPKHWMNSCYAAYFGKRDMRIVGR